MRFVPWPAEADIYGREAAVTHGLGSGRSRARCMNTALRQGKSDHNSRGARDVQVIGKRHPGRHEGRDELISWHASTSG